jgi:ribosomal protein S12 methylthiotransferase
MVSPSIWLSTLGCAKNQVDSEKIVAILSEAGYGWADRPEEADLVMVNTCAFIEEARPEAVAVNLDL